MTKRKYIFLHGKKLWTTKRGKGDTCKTSMGKLPFDFNLPGASKKREEWKALLSGANYPPERRRKVGDDRPTCERERLLFGRLKGFNGGEGRRRKLLSWFFLSGKNPPITRGEI